MSKILQLFFFLAVFPVCFVNAQSFGLEARWDDGIKFRTKDGATEFSIGGRVHYDAVFMHQSTSLDSLFDAIPDNVEVRRARLSFTGTINDAMAYEFEFTFGEQLEYADMYFAFLKVPLIEKITLGHFREPFGMEEMTSSNSIVFMERSLTSAFGPSRNTGVMLQKEFLDKKLRAYAGFFRITNDLGTDLKGNGEHSFSTRVAYQPISDSSLNRSLHVGASMRIYRPQERILEIKTQNESNIAPMYINTGEITNVSNVKQVGAEIGYSIKKLCLQSEYIHAFAVEKQVGSDQKQVRDHNSFYLMASYFLKGGTRTYSNSSNRFSSISVDRMREKGKLGSAWEIAARLSQINIAMSEEGIRRMTDVTFGLNWYFNSNSRFMMNYVVASMGDDLRANALQFRMQVTF